MPIETFLTESKKFEALDARFPVLLFPVRIETRFVPAAAPVKLKIRILPDQLLIDDHDPRLSKNEFEAGRGFWKNLKPPVTAEQRAQAWQWLVGKVGLPRAQYVALPANLVTKPDPFRGDNDQVPSTAPLLPDRWLIVGLKAGKTVIEAVSGPILKGLKFSPDLNAAAPNAKGLTVDASVKWMFDFDEAVKAGMGIEVTLNNDNKAGVDELYVLGIKSKDPVDNIKPLTVERASECVAQLFSSQLYTQGAGFAPQGMPTNNTDETEAGWSSSDTEAGKAIPGALVPPETPPKLDEVEKNYRVMERALGLKPSSVLDRLEYAEGFEGKAMAAMNTLLWGVTVGEYLNTMFAREDQPILTKTVRDWTQDWFQSKVKGGAPLPCLRFGASPYGVLPVQSTASLIPKDENEKRLKDFLSSMFRYWQSAESSLIQLTETTQGDAEPGDRLLKLLSMQPNPVEFGLTGLSNDRAAIYFAYGLLKLAVTGENSEAAKAAKPYTSGYIAKLALESSHADINAQIVTCDTLAALVDVQFKKTAKGTDLYGQLEYMKKYLAILKDLFTDHQLRARGLQLAGIGKDMLDGRIDPNLKDPKSIFSRYDTESTEWDIKRNVIVAAENPDDTVYPAAYLEYLKKYAQSKIDPKIVAGNSPFTGKPRPLLFQLVYTAIGRVATDSGSARVTELVDALELLKSLPYDQLELLMQQTLGLSGWRLDAWYTSLATSRLKQLRLQQPGGIQIGAFGWVENLRPQVSETGEKKQSQGFIHAPSLNHAKTAAVLKAGWTAYKEEQNNSGLAIDLSSERVRNASWLFDAVRQGQDLGDALGYRFERAIHEDKKDYWIAPVRNAVLKYTAADFDPKAPGVDGMELLSLWDEGKGEASLETLTKPFFTGTPPRAAELRPFLADLADVVDAMADLAIADSTHALVQGNSLRAGASLAAISRGEIPPPDLQVINTSRKGISLTHRVMLLAAEDENKFGWFKGKSDAEISPAAVASPQMENLISQLLGSMDEIRFDVGYQGPDGKIQGRREFSLSELMSGTTSLKHALGAQDLLFLLGQDSEGGTLALEDWILFFLDRQRPKDVSSKSMPVVIWDETAGEPNLSSRTLLWLQGWRDAIQRSRPVNLRDFTFQESELTGSIKIADLETRAGKLRDRAFELINRTEGELPKPSAADPHPVGGASVEHLLGQLLELARFNLVQAVPQVLDVTSQLTAYYAAVWSAFESLKERHSLIKDIAVDSTLDDDERFRRATEIIQGILGKNALASAGIQPAERVKISASFSKSASRLTKNPSQCHEWLEKMQYVSPQLRGFSEAILIQDLLGRTSGGIQFMVGQWPDNTGESWAAMSPPAVLENGRFTILAGVPSGASLTQITGTTGYLNGLLIDEVVERLPSDEETTGVAMHFDSPNTEPPQTLLLAMAPEGKTWNFDLMRETVRETLGWARRRALDGENIKVFDHHLPAVFAEKGLS